MNDVIKESSLRFEISVSTLRDLVKVLNQSKDHLQMCLYDESRNKGPSPKDILWLEKLRQDQSDLEKLLKTVLDMLQP